MPTMRDVAELAGVSSATVSFVVNGTKQVSPETRARIEAAMEQLGFRANVLARGLASRRTRIIALLYPALDHRLGISALRIITSAAAAASERGYNLVLWPVSNDGVQMVELLKGGLVDGVLLMEVQMEDPRVAALRASDTPFALIGRTRDPSAVPYVDIDIEKTMQDAVAYLRELGHRSLALVMTDLGPHGLRDYAIFQRAETAFRTAMSEEEARGVSIWVSPTQDGGREAVDEILRMLPDVSALIVINEDAASAIVARMEEIGRRVPQDVSILSVLTTPELARTSTPMLSAMYIEQAELGRIGVSLLIDALDGAETPSTQILVPSVLEVNATTSPARA